MQTTNERVLQIVLGGVRPGEMTEKASKLLDEVQGLTLADLGISSVEAQGLLKQVQDEFGVKIPDEDAEKLTSLHDLTDYLDTRA